VAAGVGTLACLAIFIAVGKKMSSWLTKNKKALNLVFATVLLIVALTQLNLIVKSLKG
jgi:hypothetical protein